MSHGVLSGTTVFETRPKVLGQDKDQDQKLQDQNEDQNYKTKTKAGLRPVLSYDRGLRPQDC